jgi:hypothetical protein
MFASVNGSTGALVSSSEDIVSSTRNGTGDYTITLNQQFDPADCAFVVTARGAATTLVPAVVHTDNSNKQVLWQTTGGTATDQDFDIMGVIART